jgi:hypothetical protein
MQASANVPCHLLFYRASGGTLSILQMVLQSYNNNDWTIFYGDLTKIGLGLFSILFDIVFIFQHYVFFTTGASEAGSGWTLFGVRHAYTYLCACSFRHSPQAAKSGARRQPGGSRAKTASVTCLITAEGGKLVQISAN